MYTYAYTHLSTYDVYIHTSPYTYTHRERRRIINRIIRQTYAVGERGYQGYKEFLVLFLQLLGKFETILKTNG